MFSLLLSEEQVIMTESYVAGILGVSIRTIRKYRNEGLLRYFQPKKKVYISYADLLEFLDGSTANNKEQEKANDESTL